MHEIRTRIHIAADGTVTGRAPRGVPPGEHDANIVVRSNYSPRPIWPDAAAKIAALQRDVARFPVLDPRSPDIILGYDENGLFC